jgi:hypothetical protein
MISIVIDRYLLVIPLLVILIALANAPEVRAQVPVSRQPAVSLDPITGVLDAFRTHAVVALGEGSHGNEQAHRFRLALIRDPRFSATVNDIVVESGSARYQDVMDRFVRGENVPADVLARAWRDTTQPTEMWDLPIYEESSEPSGMSMRLFHANASCECSWAIRLSNGRTFARSTT